MAAIDWGVIALKDGKIMPENTNPDRYVFPGAGGVISIGSLKFGKTSVLGKEHAIEWAYSSNSENAFRVDFMSELTGIRKKVLYWSYNGNCFKTKKVAKSVYLTKFKYQGHFYQVLQGYDIGFSNFWHERSKKLVKRFLRKGR